MARDAGPDPSSVYTFEVVFHENGDITFQYKEMTSNSPCRWTVTGIEDSTGFDGLMYQYGSQIPAGTAIEFTRPAPAVRAFVYPSVTGSFVTMGQHQKVPVDLSGPTVFNSGELGDDTYDLTLSVGWNASIDFLTDTNGNGVPDTGTLAQQQSRAVYIDVDAPATPAASNTTVLTATSSLDSSVTDQVAIQAAIPARFVEAYGGSRRLQIATPRGTMDFQLTPQSEVTDTMPTVLELPNGHLLYTWTSGYSSGSSYVDKLACQILDRAGQVVVDTFRLDDGLDSSFTTMIRDIATAVAPDGRIGLVWHTDRYDTSNNENDNVYFAVIDETGHVLVPPVNVTNNAAFGKDGDLGVPFISFTKIAATSDNRFLLAWQEYSTQSAGLEENVYTAIYDSAGTKVQGIVNRSGIAAGAGTAC
ncbi:MAG: hypothetical protein GXP48_07900, partial [Acidobacteria bacterium]|nr:hypothetical protein [Acidobacteriota bacterium]